MKGPIVTDIEGLTLTQDDLRRIKDPLVGMVILFSRNYESPRQLAALTREIHESAPGILIGVDQEGGRVQRFAEGFVKIPAMADYGDQFIDDPEGAVASAAASGFILAGQLRACGVDFTFAPCLDIEYGRCEVIGRRAFSLNARTVTRLALAFIAGFRKAGMSNCAKHFPGHGFVSTDSHKELPVDDRGPARILMTDTAPYLWLGTQIDSVMMAHVLYPQFDSAPAGFSKKWIDFLRHKLHFEGTVFSDDLNMKGAGEKNILGKAQSALSAGCDALILCNAPEDTDRLLKDLKWEKTPLFADRSSILAPRGAFPDFETFSRSVHFLRALNQVPGYGAPKNA